MHRKETVRYLCEEFIISGRHLFWKQELLTTESHRRPESLYWSRRKPVTRATFERAQRAGYPCRVLTVTRPPAPVTQIDDIAPKCRNKRKRRITKRKKQGAQAASERFLSR